METHVLFQVLLFWGGGCETEWILCWNKVFVLWGLVLK